MGLDGVELTMAIKEEFGISISDAEAQNSDTVGKIVKLVHSKIQYDPEVGCPFQHNFYEVRKILAEQFNFSKEAIKPDTLMRELFPRRNRYRNWKKFCKALPDSLKKKNLLKRSVWLSWTVFFVIPVIAFWIAVWHFSFSGWGGLLITIVVCVFGGMSTSRLKINFPTKNYTINDFILTKGMWNSRRVTQQEVFEKIRELTVEHLGVKTEQVTMGARWVNDLGMN